MAQIQNIDVSGRPYYNKERKGSVTNASYSQLSPTPFLGNSRLVLNSGLTAIPINFYSISASGHLVIAAD